jgi:transposase
MDRKTLRIKMWDDYNYDYNASQTAEIINKTYEESTTTRQTIHNQFKEFKNGNLSFEDKTRSGRPSVVNEARLKRIVETNLHETTVEYYE